MKDSSQLRTGVARGVGQLLDFFGFDILPVRDVRRRRADAKTALRGDMERVSGDLRSALTSLRQQVADGK